MECKQISFLLKSYKMKFFKLFFLIFCISYAGAFNALCENAQATQKVAIKWQNEKPQGRIEVSNGILSKVVIANGKGRVNKNQFNFASVRNATIDISIENANVNFGSGATLVYVKTNQNPFSFFLRDVNKDYPISIPEYNVVVTEVTDTRSYQQIIEHIASRKLQTKLQQIEKEPEESYDSASVHTRNQSCPTWLGLSRDMRIFELRDNKTNPGNHMNIIRPLNSSSPVNVPEFKNFSVEFGYMMGRGQGVAISTTKHLEDGTLPILHSILIDEDIEYHSTAFVSLEKSPLTEKTLVGTDYLATSKFNKGFVFTKEQDELLKPRLEKEQNKTEETVLYYRTEATNNSSVPRYAWFKTIRPNGNFSLPFGNYSFYKETGFSSFSSGRVFGISKLNSKPLHDEEIAVLLKPNETAVFEFYIPHSPVTNERAIELSKQSFDSRLKECKEFWKNKLDKAAQISVPEKRINEMIQAGLLHLDLITYGSEPYGTLAPTIGVYSPIGTESSPIIQFYNSMGLPDIARRSLMFFLDTQHDDGVIMNVFGYTVETGAALWNIGEYYRYTKNNEWVKQIEPKLLKACDYLLQWREKNKKEDLRGKGYGMIDGKVADPEDKYRQYMLNGYAYIGISRVAEMLAEINPAQSIRLKQEAETWKQDIRISLMNNLANSPVVPLGDGRWCPTVPAWAEAPGPRALHIIPETFFSHGTVEVPDVLLGPMYLVFCEVLDPKDPVSKMMLDYHSELFYQRNSVFSQPYYSRHNWVQLKLGLVKPFLKTYYNTFSATSDRETYTFWEHVFQVSTHKTHEEGWFLMETRWMLYLEEGQTLKLLSGVPRKWLEDSKKIELKNVASYFGPLSLSVSSNVNKGYIKATVECQTERKPQQVILRIPHPEGKKPVKITGGTYDETSESIIIKPFTGTSSIRVDY